MSTVAGLEIVAGPLRGGGALVQDYLAGRDLSAFFAAHPGDIDAYVAKAAEVQGRLDAGARARVAAAIEPLGDAAGRLSRILAGDGFFVTTGQQPALFGGPLYTLYKILAAIRLAAVLEARLEQPVLALFWIGSDDHDWDEANHAVVMDRADYAHRITVAAAPDVPAAPLSERVWGPGIDAAVAALGDALPDDAFTAEVLAHVRSEYTSGRTVASSFTATIRYLLGDRRLALIDPGHGALRRAAAPVLLRDVERFEEHAAQVGRQTERLIAAGYRAQVAVSSDASNLMLLDEHGRDRLVRGRSGWQTRRERSAISDAELQRRIEAQPDRFTPNVLLRPVVESAVLPTIAYVAGPGEISYFGQIGGLFAAHGILPPVIVPRPSVTLIEAAIRKVLDAHTLDAAAVQRPFHEVVTEVMRRELPADVQAALDSLRQSLYAEYERLTDAATKLDPTLRGPLRRARNASVLNAHEAEQRITQHAKRQSSVMVERLRRASAHLFPGGVPQERALSPLGYVARYGTGLVAAIEATLDMEPVPVANWSVVPARADAQD